MDMYTALVFSVGSIVGGIIITQLWQHNYYRKKQFNHKMWQTKQQDTIKLQSLKKELGLKKGTSNKTGLNAEDIKGLISQFVAGAGSDEPQDENWIQDVILRVAENNPEMVQELIQKFTSGGSDDGPSTSDLR